MMFKSCTVNYLKQMFMQKYFVVIYLLVPFHTVILGQQLGSFGMTKIFKRQMTIYYSASSLLQWFG